jgi:quercetin dioxygenase-like cupin family protein
VHHVGRLRDTAPDSGPYEGHGEGYERRVLVDRAAGSIHQAMSVSELAPGGRLDVHLHAFEEGLYVLEGGLRLTVAEAVEELAADDFCFVGVGVPHSLENASSQPARWFEVSAPQPGASLEDTVFVAGEAKGEAQEVAYRRDRFELGALPEPSSAIGLAGFGAANVGGASLRILMEQSFGSSQFNLMVVRYAEGGFIREHDHAFEEGFFFVGGEVEAVLDGQTYVLGAGDYCWSGVGSMHALSNRGTEPAHWLETQVPQPPSRHQARFRGEWERLTG